MNDRTPTVPETHEAKKIFLKGFEANYPGLDPRLSLLGLKENGYEYITEKYGYKLEKIPTFWEGLFNNVLERPFFTVLVIYMFYKTFIA